MMKLAICTPTTGFQRSEYTHSLAYLIGHMMSTPLFDDDTPLEWGYYQWHGAAIGGNREKLVLRAMEDGATHVLFIDEDMGFPPSGLHILASRRLPIVGANYLRKVLDRGFTALQLDKKNRVQTTAESKGVEEVDYIGLGFALIDCEVFRKTPRPWFLIGYNPEEQAYTTEDSMFCRKARHFGFKTYVDQDVSKDIVHVGIGYFAVRADVDAIKQRVTNAGG